MSGLVSPVIDRLTLVGELMALVKAPSTVSTLPVRRQVGVDNVVDEQAIVPMMNSSGIVIVSVVPIGWVLTGV
jgi:hypothetical protein